MTSRVTAEFSIVRAARSDTDCNTSSVTVDVTIVRAARKETEPNTIVLSIVLFFVYIQFRYNGYIQSKLNECLVQN